MTHICWSHSGKFRMMYIDMISTAHKKLDRHETHPCLFSLTMKAYFGLVK